MSEAVRFHTIVVPMDFSDPARRALDIARELAGVAGPAHLILVHAVFVPVEIESLGLDTTTLARTGLEERAARDLEPLLVELQDAGVSAEYVSAWGSPEQVVVDTALAKNADLIVMGTHGRTGLAHIALGSVAERVVRDAHCPVLTVRK